MELTFSIIICLFAIIELIAKYINPKLKTLMYYSYSLKNHKSSEKIEWYLNILFIILSAIFLIWILNDGLFTYALFIPLILAIFSVFFKKIF